MKRILLGVMLVALCAAVYLSCSKSKNTSPEPCKLTLTAPSSGASLSKGTSQVIRWTSSGAGENVKLDLYKGSALKCALVTSTANNGSYSWTVDDCGGGAGADYSVKVSDIGDGGCTASSGNFAMTIPCAYSVASPSTGASWTKGSTQSILWTSSGVGANVKLELFKGAVLKCTIASSTPNDGSQLWTVDDCSGGTGTDYAIKVTDVENSACNATSANFGITVPCTFTVTAPVSSTVWVRGSTQAILWTSTGTGTNVKVELYKGSTLQCVVANAVANNGSYSWVVDECSGGTGSDYSLKISDVANGECFIVSTNFTIVVPCSFLLTTPNIGTNWTKGSTQSIQWTSTGSAANVKIDLYKLSVFQCAIAVSVPNGGSYSWVVDDCGGGTASDYSIKISDVNNPNCSAPSADFTITIPCNISVTSPSSQSVWLQGSSQSLYWTSNGASDSVKIDLYKGTQLVAVLASSFQNDGAAQWTSVDDYGAGEGADYRIKISDLKNQQCYGFSDYFTITVPCSISIVSPSSFSVWARGSTQSLSWTTSGFSDSVRIDLFKGSVMIATLAFSFSNSGSASWVVNEYGWGVGTDFSVRISDVKKPTCFAFSENFMIFMPCTFTVISPSSGSSWEKGSTRTIQWTPSGGIAHVKLQLFKGGTSLNCTIASSIPNFGSYSWLVDDCGSGSGSDYWIKISDADNDTCNGFSDDFSITASSIVVQSHIVGDFNGFSYENLYELDNGQIWEQTDFTIWVTYKYRPEVIITLSSGIYRIQVVGDEHTAKVHRIQ